MNLFVDTLKKDNSLLVDFLNTKIYNLVPKTFSDSFNGELEAYFNDIISNSIISMKNQYNSLIRSNLNKVVNLLTEYGNEVSNKVAEAAIIKLATEWIPLSRLSKNLSNYVSNFDDSFVFIISENKKLNIRDFYYTIYNYIHYIKDDFDFQVQIGQKQLDDYLSNFEVGDQVTTVRNLLESKNKTEDIILVRSNLALIFINLVKDILKEFNNFNETLMTECSTIEMTGFNKKRNLGEGYNLSEIESAFKEIEEKYEEFKTKVLGSESFSDISSHKRGFIMSLTNSASSLTNNFYDYEVLLAQYINVDKLTKYFNNLEEQATKIRKEVNNYIDSNVALLNHTVQSIYTQLT